MKVAKHVEVEVAELAMVTMEAFGKGIKVDRLCRSASEKMSLKVSTSWLFLRAYFPDVQVTVYIEYVYNICSQISWFVDSFIKS